MLVQLAMSAWTTGILCLCSDCDKKRLNPNANKKHNITVYTSLHKTQHFTSYLYLTSDQELHYAAYKAAAHDFSMDKWEKYRQ